ncbi:MAG: deoxyribonuclease IV [Erysipelotrichaceae bacterium]|nr:deoxyribonuclease IV [Erysipelotrichaceae bacterium]
MKLGSHVSMNAPEYVLGSVKEALSYKANTFMIYTGAPQNSFRAPLEKLKVTEGDELWQNNGYDLKDIVIHCPYIINLANTLKPETYEMGKEVLKKEILRTRHIGARYMVLHPGSSLTGDVEESLKQVTDGLNEVLKDEEDIIICLETMAGKGSEVGRTFEQIRFMIDRVEKKDLIGVCMDTCHVNDAGYDLTDFDAVLADFNRVIGLDYLKVMHINDSKNPIGAHKDRHANIGEGTIGLETLQKVIHHPLLDNIPQILETPFVGGQAPYKEEIAKLLNL